MRRLRPSLACRSPTTGNRAIVLPDITGSYEELLRQQADQLAGLKIRAGNPSLRTIEKRAQELFAAEGVSLAPSTLSGLFNGSYASRSRLQV
ncbi:hypothetical protein ACIQ6Y_32790 [Streptomyces sp. NPDC096205]|uniref:hypothetical protein n=1 Tax=Streptomyces sp. NPDC096205 TaxID=3366081 RepID=UPI00382B3554